ncbi:MAG: hypothetical protein ILP19_00670 [Oscillospiraceae bacterium]|nr:hypothetical protein [Oscillospiraceae bacterium]
MNRIKLIAAVIIILFTAVCLYIYYRSGVRRAVPGIGEPVQKEASGHYDTMINGFNVHVNYRYSYDIEALVVHTKSYSGMSLGDRLAPVDAALAWGQVAAKNDSIDFHWHQINRYYMWSVDSYNDIADVGGIDGVSCQSANNHLIPADKIAERQIKRLKRGDHVRIKGYLADVNATKPDGSYFYWNTSTTREDTGAGACELIYVTDVIMLE